MGKLWGFSAQNAILCQNGHISHEKQWNDLLIYVKSGAIVYPQPRIHNSVGWAWSRVNIIIVIIIVIIIAIIIIIIIIIIKTYIWDSLLGNGIAEVYWRLFIYYQLNISKNYLLQ